MASLKEIARETQLAEATVSRILRRRDQCSPETRRRVWEVARRLKYRPNMLVQGMQTGRTKTVGVLLPLASEFFGRIFAGIHDALVAADHVPIVLWCHDELAKPGDQGETLEPTELAQVYRLIDRRVDGVILRPVDDAVDDTYLREVWERDIPLIAVDRELEFTHADFVGIDDEAVGRQAAEHLLSLGHRRLGHVAGPDDVTTSRRRREGFERAVREAGATCVTVVDSKFGLERQPIVELLSRPDGPTAVFAVNDEVAANVYEVAEARGLSIPRDLSVIGVGNLSMAKRVRPELTTFDQHPERIGREAVRLLLGRVDQAQPAGADDRSRRAGGAAIRLRLDATFVPRDSTAPPSGR